MYWPAFCLIIFFSLLSGCGEKKTSPELRSQPIVLVSIAPYQDIVGRIGQDKIQVQPIVTPGANIHYFEPTVRQTQSLNTAKIWFRIGEPFEKKLVPLFQNQMQIVDLRDGIELLSLDQKCSCCEDIFLQDRHMWMSIHILKKQAVAIAEALSQQFPEERVVFQKNLNTLLADLDSLDEEIKTSLTPDCHRSLLVSHPAFGYFCKDYSLKQISIEFEGKEPCPQYLQLIMENAKKDLPNVVITMPQHNNKGAQMIAKELQLPIKEIDPYSNHYFEMMRTLAKWISLQ